MDLLVQIETVMAEAARRSGSWIACRPGCFECCLGEFGIARLDELRLQAGIARLAADDPARAARVRTRAAEYVPGDDAPCPALDPATGCCDLYEHRPFACRLFGPATRIGGGDIAACELCYRDASESDIALCAVDAGPLLEANGADVTTVARALR